MWDYVRRFELIDVTDNYGHSLSELHERGAFGEGIVSRERRGPRTVYIQIIFKCLFVHYFINIFLLPSL